jgi:tetratricopeptide (TPR) repeat protein
MVLAARGSEEAVPLLREAVAEARDLKRAGLEARALLEIGFATEGEEAEGTVRRALEIGRSAGLDHVEILGETRLAELALERDDLQEAERAAGAAIERLRVHRNVQGPEELVHLVQSRVLERAGRPGEAERHLDEALRLVREKAARIEDERLRRAFLSLDPAPEILAAGDAEQKAAP